MYSILIKYDRPPARRHDLHFMSLTYTFIRNLLISLILFYISSSAQQAFAHMTMRKYILKIIGLRLGLTSQQLGPFGEGIMHLVTSGLEQEIKLTTPDLQNR